MPAIPWVCDTARPRRQRAADQLEQVDVVDRVLEQHPGARPASGPSATSTGTSRRPAGSGRRGTSRSGAVRWPGSWTRWRSRAKELELRSTRPTWLTSAGSQPRRSWRRRPRGSLASGFSQNTALPCRGRHRHQARMLRGPRAHVDRVTLVHNAASLEHDRSTGPRPAKSPRGRHRRRTPREGDSVPDAARERAWKPACWPAPMKPTETVTRRCGWRGSRPSREHGEQVAPCSPRPSKGPLRGAHRR